MRGTKNIGCILPLTLLAVAVILVGLIGAAILYDQGVKLSGNQLTEGASRHFYFAAFAAGVTLCLLGLMALAIWTLLEEVNLIAKEQRALADQVQSIKAATVSKYE